MYRAYLCIVIAGLICLVGLGCQNETQDNEAQTAHFLGSDPANGTQIVIPHSSKTSIRLFFDREPLEVTIFGQKTKISGNTATWTGWPNELSENSSIRRIFPIAWVNPDGTKGEGAKITLDILVDTGTSPRITEGNVRDGAKNIAPDVLNYEGVRLEFDRPIHKSELVLFTRENQTVIAFRQIINGKYLRFEMFKGAKLHHNTTYLIEGAVEDRYGNPTAIQIEFTTQE